MTGKCAFRLLRLTMFLLALAGVAVSAYLVYLHYGAAQGGIAGRLCSGSFDCASVLQSRWGTVSLGPIPIPISIVGAAYFMALAVWVAIIGRLPGRLHHACAGPALLATVGAAESIHLIYVMGVELQAWCGFCLVTHAINFLLVIGLWTQWLAGCRAQSQEDLAAAPGRQLWKVPALAMVTAMMLGVTLLSLFGFVGMFMLYHSARWEAAKVLQDAEYQRWKFSSTEARTLAVRPDDPALGPADAPHTVVMFGDFQCTYCRQVEETLRDVQEDLDGDFRLVFKHYPLNRDCNAAVDASKAGHAFGCLAAEAAEAARRLGGNEAFWQMHDALYTNQKNLDMRPYDRLAGEIGLDVSAFRTMMADPLTRQRIAADAALGAELGIEGTPALYLDGRRVTLAVIMDRQTQEPDLAGTVEHWRNLLSAAAVAAATQPADASVTSGYDEVSNVLPVASVEVDR